ncbi:MAG: sigma-70 family RNA polymerase sigma factor [Rikenellaceae bacterium]
MVAEIRRCGDGYSKESIFKRYSASIKGFIEKQISSTSKNEAEDILHDVFYKYMVSVEEEETIENIAAWLYRVTRNLLIDRTRKRHEVRMPYLKNRDGEQTQEISLADLTPNKSDSPEDELIRTLIREELDRALTELPNEQRRIFELNELQGIPFKEISEATGIPINTLISRKRYATLHLRKRLNPLYNELYRSTISDE